MTIQTYQLLHVLGILILFLSLGAMLVSSKIPKGAVIGHGVGLLILLVSGFGRIARMKYHFDLWLIVKLIAWLLLGASLVVMKRGLLPPKAAAALVVILGGVSAWCAIYKPGIGEGSE